MGIEQNNQGAYLPDKDTQWPKMTTEERSKVYGSLKESYGSPLKNLDAQTEQEKQKLEAEIKKSLDIEIDDFWQEIRDLDLRNRFEANDPKLKGMPVSMALLLTFQEKELGDFRGKEKQLMYFCLHYLQNAPENKAKNPTGNIDFVPRDGKVVIAEADEANNFRPMLRILNKDEKVLFEGYLFPNS